LQVDFVKVKNSLFKMISEPILARFVGFMFNPWCEKVCCKSHIDYKYDQIIICKWIQGSLLKMVL